MNPSVFRNPIFYFLLVFHSILAQAQISVSGTNTATTINSTTATAVAPDITVAAGAVITDFTVSIVDSYSPSDVLFYSGTLPSGVVAEPWSTTTRSLVFKGSASAAEWQSFLRTVTITSGSVCSPETRKVSFAAGETYYNPLNGHFYRLTDTQSSWTDAQNTASSTSYYGREGYLVTLTNDAENTFVSRLVGENSWMGASDDHTQINNALGYTEYANTNASEGKFYWVTGPERGTQMTTDNGNSNYVPGVYQNWRNSEPNDFGGGESFGHVYTGAGDWNDFPNTQSIYGIIEFGDMPNDVITSEPQYTQDIFIQGSSSGTISGGEVTVCSGTNSTTLTLNGLTGTVVRWESSTNNFITTGTSIANTTTTLNVSNISETTYYRAVVNSTSPSACNGLLTSSTPVFVSEPNPGNVFAENTTICAASNVELFVSGEEGTVQKWQWSADNTNWNDIASTETTLTETIADEGTRYYRVLVEIIGCGAPAASASKEITIVNGSAPVGGAVSSAAHGSTTNSGSLSLSGHTGTITKWQQSTDDGIIWSDISNTTTSYSYANVNVNTLFRAQLANGSCGTTFSTVGSVVILDPPSIAGFTPNVAGNGDVVTITGSGFTGTTGISFGASSALNFTIVSDTEITAIVGTGASGSISVTNPAGTATETGFIYKIAQFDFENNPLDATDNNYDGTEVNSITYDTGAEGQSICFDNGPGFVRLPDGLISGLSEFTISLRFKTTGTGSILGYQNVAASTSNTPGNWIPILMVTSDGRLKGTLWTSANNSIQAISNNAVNDGNWHQVDFTAGTNSVAIYLDGVLQASQSGASVAHLDMDFNQLGFSFTNGYNQSPTTWEYFNGCLDNLLIVDRALTELEIEEVTELPEPTITSFTPIEARQGDTVTITGTNFEGATQVTFGGIDVASYTVDSQTQITAVVGTGTSGNLEVTTAGGTATATGFTFVQINELNADGTPIRWAYTIADNNFYYDIPNPVHFKAPEGMFIRLTTIESGREFTIDTNLNEIADVEVYLQSLGSSEGRGWGDIFYKHTDGVEGSQDWSYWTKDHEASAYGPPPTIDSFTPDTAGFSDSVVITGTNFSDIIEVQFGAADAISFTIDSDTQITAVLGNGGTGDVTVTNSGGTATATGFTYVSDINENGYVNGAFVTTWKTDNPGFSDDNTIFIPTNNDLNYDYHVDWDGDGVFDTFNVTDEAEHTYDEPGTYTVQIRGVFPAIYFNDERDADKILTVEQWGDTEWQSMRNAFAGCENVQFTATDVPDLSNVTNMEGMLSYATAFNSLLNNWDVSSVENMAYLFDKAEAFDQPLNAWDVSNVEDMNGMFEDATTFNQPLDAWDVGKVEDMDSMFEDAESFNQDISSWNVSSVIDMAEMFEGAITFNQPLNAWNVGNVDDMGDLFEDATSFNQPLSGWNVSNVTDMADMFKGTTKFNQDISAWDVSNVDDMSGMFSETEEFNQPLANWDVSEVFDMSHMFYDAKIFNQPLNAWDVSDVGSMTYMFDSAISFDQDISNWDVSNVWDMEGMFIRAISFNQDISNWDVGGVDNMDSMFEEARSFNQDLSAWNVENVTKMGGMFENSALSVANYDAILTGWSELPLQEDVRFSVGTLGYCIAGTERQKIMDDFNWTIIDGGLNCDDEAPSNYTVSFDQDPIDRNNVNNASFSLGGAEIGSSYYYTITPANATGEVLRGNGAVTQENQTIIIDVLPLENGPLSLSLYLRDSNNNQGSEALALAIKNVRYLPQFINPELRNPFEALFQSGSDENTEVLVPGGGIGEGSSAGISSFEFGPDGQLLFLVDALGEVLEQYDLSTPYDLSTASLAHTADLDVITGMEISPSHLTMNPNGSQLLVYDTSSEKLYDFELTTPFDLTSLGSSPAVFDNGEGMFFPEASAITFSPNGKDIYLATDFGIGQFGLISAYDPQIESFKAELDLGNNNNSILNIRFNNKGTKLYLTTIGSLSDAPVSILLEYDLRTPFMLGGATLVSTTEVPVETPLIVSDLSFDPTGTKSFLSIVLQGESSAIGAVDLGPELTFQENGNGPVTDIDANDGDGGALDANVTYSLGETPDAQWFNIAPDTGELNFNVPPNFEYPQDEDQDNVYAVSLIATDQDGDTSGLSIRIEVLDEENETLLDYTVSIDQDTIDADNQGEASFTFINAELGSTYSYSLTDEAGTAAVTGSGSAQSLEDQVGQIDLSALADGVLTLSFQLTFTSGDEGPIVNATVTKSTDADQDGVDDGIDECPNTPSGETVDENGCSDSQKDTDNDGVSDLEDLCPDTPQGEIVDAEGCSLGQTDSDFDGIFDDVDNCVSIPNEEQLDTDLDGLGNVCDEDDDGDGTPDSEDAFPLDENEDIDTDGDGTGDNEDEDDDGDGILDTEESGRGVLDTDGDGIPDSADTDDDNDGILDSEDSFPLDITPLLVPAEAFTPNGDGINDTWVVPGIDNYPNNMVRVYNRWGHEIYSKQGYRNEWDGSAANSNVLPSGSYLYIIELGNGAVPLQGWIFINY